MGVSLKLMSSIQTSSEAFEGKVLELTANSGAAVPQVSALLIYQAPACSTDLSSAGNFY